MRNTENGQNCPFFAVSRVGRRQGQQLVQLSGDPTARDEMATAVHIKHYAAFGAVLPCDALKAERFSRAPVSMPLAGFCTSQPVPPEFDRSCGLALRTERKVHDGI